MFKKKIYYFIIIIQLFIVIIYINHKIIALLEIRLLLLKNVENWIKIIHTENFFILLISDLKLKRFEG